MSVGEDQIRRIQDKLQLLLKKHQTLQKENVLLKEELAGVKGLTSAQQANMEQMKSQLDILKYNNGDMSDDDKKLFERRINTYLKEIDRCIAMLGE